MTLGTNLLKLYYAEHSLPAGYRRVEYLESTGKQYIILTRVNQESNEYTVTCWYEPLVLDSSAGTSYNTGYSCIFGVNSNMQLGYYQGGYATVGNTNSSQAVFTLAKVLVSARFSASSGNTYYHVGANNTGLQRSTNTTSDPWLFIPALSSISSYSVTKGRLYSLEITGGVSRNFVPCVRIADNKPGMYDLYGSICPLTNSPFYVNSGTGADFTWGELQF